VVDEFAGVGSNSRDGQTYARYVFALLWIIWDDLALARKLLMEGKSEGKTPARGGFSDIYWSRVSTPRKRLWYPRRTRRVRCLTMMTPILQTVLDDVGRLSQRCSRLLHMYLHLWKVQELGKENGGKISVKFCWQVRKLQILLCLPFLDYPLSPPSFFPSFIPLSKRTATATVT
jgi:hypothetical protein